MRPERHRLTLSCSRCRAAKLKCDRNEPCNECVKRDVGHMCTKDQRQPRAKKAKTTHSNNADEAHGTEVEDTAHLLEKFVEGAYQNDTQAPKSATAVASQSTVAPDYPTPNWTFATYPPELDLLREIVKKMPTAYITRKLHDNFVMRCPAVLGNTIHTPTFNKQTETLHKCLIKVSRQERALDLASHFDMDELACLLMALVLGLAFYFPAGSSDNATKKTSSTVEALRVSGSPQAWRELAYRCLQGRVSMFCGSIAGLQAAVMFLLDGYEDFLELDALLVTAISGARKLGLHRLGEANLKLEASISDTLPSDGLHFTMPPVERVIRTEIGVRIWWALVLRDWSRGQALGYYNIHPSSFNTRMPLHINDDDLCPTGAGSQVEIRGRPRSEFTMLSYTVYSLELATLMRESLDLQIASHKSCQQPQSEKARTRENLCKKYENFLAGLPSYFQLESSEGNDACGPLAAIPVHRWMLQQQLWGLFLRLHREDLSSPESFATCRLLAKSVIDCAGQIRTRCTVCGSLSIGDAQLFNAASIFIIDLLRLSKVDTEKDVNARMNQLMARSNIAKSLELFQERKNAATHPQNCFLAWNSAQKPQLQRVKASTYRCIMALRALSDLEKKESEAFNESGDKNRSEEPLGNKQASSLRDKVRGTLESLPKTIRDEYAARESSAEYPEVFSNSGILPRGADDPDLDVLPMLTNDPNDNLWGLFDSPSSSQFPVMDGIFPAPVDWQILIDSMPDEPSLQEVKPLDIPGTM